jgi:hypothetical protein
MAVEDRIIDIQGSAAECPPPGMYTFTVVGVTDPEEKPGFNVGDIDVQTRVNLRLQGYDYDEDDEDDFDWNGETVTHFVVWYRYVGGDKDKPRAIYKSERSNAGKFLMAIHNISADALQDMGPVDLDALTGKKVMASLTESARGYPKLSNFAPVRQKAKKVRTEEDAPKPARKAEPVQTSMVDDQDADLYPEDDVEEN